ncbi:MAG: methyltransferase domain-containing protein [Actinobacteria bacterium]|nr:methyltransferase domain-containing protein [Actinomycetota bacterium]MBU1942320.1 methyltransferase domain-containing protein [Actinomycetota bacterium]MBU2686876.1 methyltransferase domain-containing protein [Actinomycetota bacterium]
MAKDYSIEIDLTVENNSHTKLIRMCAEGMKVLDVGCHRGHLARALKEMGCTVTGIEIDPEAAAQAAEACERVVIADMDSLDITEALPGEMFDAVLFGDVLEHLKSPHRILNDVRERLAPGGFIGLSVPNIAHASIRLALLRGEFDYADFGILDDTHLRFFTRKSICDLVESCGYVIESLDWTESGIPEDELERTLDPFGPVPRQQIIEYFTTPESKAIQYIVKAFPASEADRVRKLSEDKIAAERRVRELEGRVDELNARIEATQAVERELAKLKEALEQTIAALERTTTYADELASIVRQRDEFIAEKTAYIKALEEAVSAARLQVAALEDEVERLSTGGEKT